MRTNDKLTGALIRAREELLAARNARGHWSGELSSSALSTATAVCALATMGRSARSDEGAAQPLIDGGLHWLAKHANADGGWGDTVLSKSNISTTTLCWAAFGAVPGADARFQTAVRAAERWLDHHAGGTDPERLVPAIVERYGEDRTFSVPILTMCAIAGRLGSGREAWRHVLPLPFELAACPHRWFGIIGLPVVSYALPALIAIGQARHQNRPSANPLARVVRSLTRGRTLRLLTEIQPTSGGFLEATPLTSFVVMSLAASGQSAHPAARKGTEFLEGSVRPDGSWPIDTNLATWVTTLAVNALGQDPDYVWPAAIGAPVTQWLLGQQYREEHSYTHARPGGWAWTDLPGGVPDADDTAGALLALRHLGAGAEVAEAARLGVRWLLDLQNKDGGIPTFCRGWGKLPFDRSSPDLTSHAVRAWLVWHDQLPAALSQRVRVAVGRAGSYLAGSQNKHGWAPLWFGNQYAADESNLTYGNARVLAALSHCEPRRQQGESWMPDLQTHARRAVNWLLAAQNPDGAWGGSLDGPPSIEETALALEGMSGWLLATSQDPQAESPEIRQAVQRGAAYLADRVEDGSWTSPSPIGFYFARLWYFEKLYPLIFTVGALGQASRALRD